jgi:alpha-L-fucosidase
VVLKEYLGVGQHCARFRLVLKDQGDKVIKEIEGTTIGRKRIITFPTVNVNDISLEIESQKDATHIEEIEAYLIDDQLVEQVK